jgi:predicted polyphosphate/ATP-dependent NAD kinase
MTFNNWAFIYRGMGDEDPAVDRAVIERGGLRTTIVAVPHEADTAAVAAELVDAGAQLIELCGGFGAGVLPAVVEATGGRVPVGQVSYGMEAIPGLAALFAPAAS